VCGSTLLTKGNVATTGLLAGDCETEAHEGNSLVIRYNPQPPEVMNPSLHLWLRIPIPTHTPATPPPPPPYLCVSQLLGRSPPCCLHLTLPLPPSSRQPLSSYLERSRPLCCCLRLQLLLQGYQLGAVERVTLLLGLTYLPKEPRCQTDSACISRVFGFRAGR
jgi:hypothetical protein